MVSLAFVVVHRPNCHAVGCSRRATKVTKDALLQLSQRRLIHSIGWRRLAAHVMVELGGFSNFSQIFLLFFLEHFTGASHCRPANILPTQSVFVVHRVFEAGEKNKDKQNKFITLEQAQK